MGEAQTKEEAKAKDAELLGAAKEQAKATPRRRCRTDASGEVEMAGRSAGPGTEATAPLDRPARGCISANSAGPRIIRLQPALISRRDGRRDAAQRLQRLQGTV